MVRKPRERRAEPEGIAVEISRKPTAEVAEAHSIKVTEPVDETAGGDWNPIQTPVMTSGYKLLDADGKAIALFFGGGPAVRKRRVEMAVEAINAKFR